MGPNKLLQGLGECHFEDAGDAVGFDGGDRWSTAFSATWEAGHRFPTLAIGNYVDRNNPDGPFEACDVNELHRPEGERYGAPLLLEPGFCALSMLFDRLAYPGHCNRLWVSDRHCGRLAGRLRAFHRVLRKA